MSNTYNRVFNNDNNTNGHAERNQQQIKNMIQAQKELREAFRNCDKRAKDGR